jgi:hypothetical protein
MTVLERANNNLLDLGQWVYLPVFARKRLGEQVLTITNTHWTIEELWDASFPMRFLSYQKKEGDYFYPRTSCIILIEPHSFLNMKYAGHCMQKRITILN